MQAQEARVPERLLLTLLDQSIFLLAAFTTSGLLVDCNHGLCVATGEPRDWLLGKTAPDLSRVFPLPELQEWDNLISRIQADGEVVLETNPRKFITLPQSLRVALREQSWQGETYVVAVGLFLPESEPLSSRVEREALWQRSLLNMATHSAVLQGDLVGAIAFATDTVTNVLPSDACRVWQINGNVVSLLGGSDAQRQAAQTVSFDKEPSILPTLQTGRAMDWLASASTPEESAEIRDFLKQRGLSAAIIAPILVGANLWGVLTIGSVANRQWENVEFAFAGQVADQISLAVYSHERVQAEAELRTSRERYRSFSEMGSELMGRIEFDTPIPLSLSESEQRAALVERGYIADCNDAVARFLGAPSGTDVRGLRVRDIAHFWGMNKGFVQVVREGYRTMNLETVCSVNGDQRWMLQSFQGTIENGALVRLWSAARDITEFKRAKERIRQGEERYSAFVTNSSEGISLLEFTAPISTALSVPEICRAILKTGRVAEANQAFARLCGVEDRSRIVGHSLPASLAGVSSVESCLLTFIDQSFQLSAIELPVTVAQVPCWFRCGLRGIVEDGLLREIWITAIDVTEQKKVAEELRLLSAHLSTVLEQERTRLAREIHDELGQQLTALKFEAAAWENGRHAPVKGRLTGEIDAVIRTVRQIATELRPVILDQFGLGAAIEWQAAEFERRTGITHQVEVDHAANLDKTTATVAFRILQEALTNVARHSEASRVSINLSRTGGRISLTIADNGKGFDAAETEQSYSLGLIGMRERAQQVGGDCSIRRLPEGGTLVAVWLPIGSEAATA